MQLHLESLYTADGGGALLSDVNGNGYDVPSDFFNALTSFVSGEDATRLTLLGAHEQQSASIEHIATFLTKSAQSPAL